jgi:hypothetical protein
MKLNPISFLLIGPACTWISTIFLIFGLEMLTL